jgi:sirohydrochlorin ferrochelatase
MPKPTVLIVGHGSREAAANRQFKNLVRQYAIHNPQLNIAYGFLELARPSIREELERLASFSNEIRVLPLFLFAAGHISRDFPRIFKDFSAKHPRVKIKMTNILGSDRRMAQLAYIRTMPLKGQCSKTMVLMVGRGSKNKRALKDFGKIVRIFRKKGRFKQVLHCYFDIATPNFEKTLKKTVLLRPVHLWVVPFLLFKGKLIFKINERMKRFSQQHPMVQVQIAEPLGTHPLLFKIMDDRLKGMRR